MPGSAPRSRELLLAEDELELVAEPLGESVGRASQPLEHVILDRVKAGLGHQVLAEVPQAPNGDAASLLGS